MFRENLDLVASQVKILIFYFNLQPLDDYTPNSFNNMLYSTIFKWKSDFLLTSSKNSLYLLKTTNYTNTCYYILHFYDVSLPVSVVMQKGLSLVARLARDLNVLDLCFSPEVELWGTLFGF